MKYVKIPLVFLLALTITSWSIAIGAPAPLGATTQQSTALDRGYRTGYSDGYSAGSRDIADHAARDYQSKDEYQRGDRNFNEAWGTAEDYRDGYQQGFESGYSAGYERRAFDSSIPTGLKVRGTVNSAPVNSTPVDSDQNATQNATQNSTQSATQTTSGQSGNIPSTGPLSIPRDAILLVELQNGISSDVSQRGDPFQARVVDPREFEGAIVEGRVTRVKRAGKVKGTAELQLSFERLRMPDGRTTSFNADVVEVVDMGNRDDAGTADSEGGVRGRSSTKDDVSKVGASTGIGAVIGLIVGGGKGAAIGAAIGGAVGAGSVLTKRGQDVRLPQGQQLKIRTATETRIQ
jgi:hypothetical protein